MLARLILRIMSLAEHRLCSDDNNGPTHTRTTLANPLIQWIHWNMPYHAEHHLYPSIPFHRLAQAHREIGQHFTQVAPSSLETQRRILQHMSEQT